MRPGSGSSNATDERPEASVNDDNEIGDEVPETDIAAVEAAALEWWPPAG